MTAPPPAPRTASRPGHDDPPALQAALRARGIAGDDEAIGDDARRDAFAAFLYGMALVFVGREDTTDDTPLAERVDLLATTLVRRVIGLAFRDACRAVEAVADALVASEPDPAVVGLVHGGAAAAGDWIDGDAGAFESHVLEATASDAFASERALRARR
ncbi:MAG: hypothetical protein EHM87_09330 [Burkholderiales bacterium]|nr:MAG: hypothetical protein EHM87_09330 [Burkholderiales bacterium]